MIFYMSGTGNTRWAATTIAQATGEKLVNILDKGLENTSYRLDDGECLGFCFPVHGWRPPKTFRDFIGRLDIGQTTGHYCYALCTAGDNIGETIDILRGDLAKKGIRLDSAFSLVMPESYVGLPFMDVDTPENEARKKAKAAADLARFIEIIKERRTGAEELTIGRWPRINSRLLGGFFTIRLITDKPFHVTTDLCTGCGLCAASCPTGNITPGDANRPIWRHDGTCLACFACYH
ncbi:MAG TPA: EFR1 family ferrodoxin, partial [Candidatus Prevotella stercoripullorum]|nr:EFR1 family ferrodoxin [Candidatus Prevotella stercoripullorum]